MRNRLLTVSLCLIVLSFVNRGVLLAAAGQKPAEHAAAMPDKAYLQKIWDGWATLDPAQEGNRQLPADGASCHVGSPLVPHIEFAAFALRLGG